MMYMHYSKHSHSIGVIAAAVELPWLLPCDSNTLHALISVSNYFASSIKVTSISHHHS